MTVERLELPAPGDEWRYAIGATLLPGPGCYAFHVSGTGVDERIVFRPVRHPGGR